jgi:hypothetical protein
MIRSAREADNDRPGRSRKMDCGSRAGDRAAGHNYCRMCGGDLNPGFAKKVRVAVASTTAHKFCGYCGCSKGQCSCFAQPHSALPSQTMMPLRSEVAVPSIRTTSMMNIWASRKISGSGFSKTRERALHVQRQHDKTRKNPVKSSLGWKTLLADGQVVRP